MSVYGRFKVGGDVRQFGAWVTIRGHFATRLEAVESARNLAREHGAEMHVWDDMAGNYRSGLNAYIQPDGTAYDAPEHFSRRKLVTFKFSPVAA